MRFAMSFMMSPAAWIVFECEADTLKQVRVPLNTALLAVQNMASRPIAQDHELEFSALEGSLSMMSKVLNDVLDFLSAIVWIAPYAFHKVLRSTFIPLRLAADARHLEFETDLDMRIDDIARRAAYQAMDAAPEVITQHLHQTPSSETAVGVVVGDETRLRQIITNLASNACKFTPAGGKLTIRTRLVIPAAPCTMLPPVPVPPPLVSKEGSSELTETALTLHNESVPPDPKVSSPFAPLERIVVRIEIIDTGSGIPPKDMVQCKLFSAFNQTEQGRQQGGKGTGLGLALVRQIVKLSGGRLGLKSKVGVGSTFWVEIPLGVGRKAMEPSPGTPSSQAHPQTQFPFTGHNLNPGSIGSVASVAEAVDAATKAASQPHPQQTRSESALHGLMDQGGRFELMLSKYDSHSPMPTRTLGDTSTGTEYPLSTPEIETQPLPEVVPVPPPLEDGGSGGETVKPRQPRPTYVPLPPPFTVEGALEVALSPGQASNASSISASQTVPVGLYVLVVDDDAMTRTLMTRMLERLGCRVSSAENGEVALHKILGEDTSPAQSRASAEPPPPVAPGEPRYAVVFLDNQMPKLSGVKVVERLRAMKRTDFVVGVTGNALLTDQKEYLDAGADHVLTKPVLEASLRKMLGLADARRRGVGC
ncbi:hypothetical protein HMN09_00686100 [Mycena chlorophos]|uniref:histidine kinase n=1 Tax=Mycena chlorophos TaxID=658473 RepID=A0A8H6SY48_MYCCL|nr:hypothetical protein HMN09_00686100 [Mycena chlorophos]